MATILSKFTSGQLATAVSPRASVPVVNQYFVDATVANLALNNVFDIGILPAGHTVTSAVLLSDDLDSGVAAIALDVGIMSGTPGDAVSARTVGAELFSADVGARTGVATAMTLASGYKIKPTSDDRSFGVKVQAAAATPVAGRIRLQVTMVAGDTSTQF